MAEIIVTSGKVDWLSVIKADSATWEWALFKNNITPTIATVLADLIEANFSGYARVAAAFGAVTVDGFNRATMSQSGILFSHSGGATANSVYGWALIQPSGTPVLLACGLLPSPPKTFALSGDTETLAATLTFDQA